MKPCVAMLALIISLAASQARASDRGELLYVNHCQGCHGINVHTRVNRLVKTPEQLRAWVMSWTVHNSLDWGEQEVADITAFLNRRFYRFSD